MNTNPKQISEQNKLLILYLLNINPRSPKEQSIDTQSELLMLTELQITRIASDLTLMGYIDLKECLFELKESHDIEEFKTPHSLLFCITDKGRSIITAFVDDIRLSSRKAIGEYITENSEELQKESQYVSEYLKLSEKEYRVTMKVLEKNSTVFEINTIVYSKEQAELMSEKWRDAAVDIYRDMMLKFY